MFRVITIEREYGCGGGAIEEVSCSVGLEALGSSVESRNSEDGSG